MAQLTHTLTGSDNVTTQVCVSVCAGVCVCSHHAAGPAGVPQSQAELPGPARVHAELQPQSLAPCPGQTQRPDPGVTHRHPHRHEHGAAAGSSRAGPTAARVLRRGRHRGRRSPAARAESHVAGEGGGRGGGEEERAAPVLGRVGFIRSPGVWGQRAGCGCVRGEGKCLPCRPEPSRLEARKQNRKSSRTSFIYVRGETWPRNAV